MDNTGDKNVPPPADASKCYIYYDESELGSCDLFKGGRPGNHWFDGSHQGQTCAERIAWWSGQTWHQCTHDSGLPYPGNEVIKIRDDAYIITKMDNTGDKNVPPPADASK